MDKVVVPPYALATGVAQKPALHTLATALVAGTHGATLGARHTNTPRESPTGAQALLKKRPH